MEINFTINEIEATLTDEQTESKNSIPVLLMGGKAYGPNDNLPIWPENHPLSFLREFASTTASVALKDELLTPKAQNLLRRFA